MLGLEGGCIEQNPTKHRLIDHSSHHVISPHTPPIDFPAYWRWAQAARDDALSLFPQRCFEEFRVDKQLFGRRLSIVSDPETIAFVFGKGARHYRLSHFQKRLLEPTVGDGLVLAEGSDWVALRRVSMGLTRSAESNLVALEATINARVDRLIDNLYVACGRSSARAVEEGALFDAISAATLDLLAMTVFRHEGPIANDAVLEAVRANREAMEQVDLADVLGVSPHIWTSRMRRSARAARRFDQEIISSALAVDHPLIVEAGLHGSALRDLVVSMLSGFESSALSVMWALGLAASLPCEADAVRRCKRTRVSRHMLDGPESSALGRFIAETMRLYPPLPFLFRVAVDDHDTPVGRIHRGAMVAISPFVVQRHRKLWNSPDRFSTARFKEDAPTAFMPFGLGARRCVGMGLGVHIVGATIHRIIQKCELRLGAPLPAVRGGVSLRPRAPISLMVSHRRSGSGGIG